MKRTFLGIMLLFSVTYMFAQARVRGMDVSIIDEKFQPLPYVNVYSESGFGGTSDENGVIELPSDLLHRVFEFSFTGYEPVSLSFYDIRKKGARIQMKPAEQLLTEIVVVGRTDALKEDIPYQVESISSKDIVLENPKTSAEAMEASGQIFVQRSQAGGGSPVLRGFEANKVLLVVDGVRMNNAIYRSGHLQNAITIDNSALDKLEVIFGPGSLMYGSDALGGVIHFRTRRPSILTKDRNIGQETKAAGFIRFASANLEKTAHVDFDHARRKFGMFTSFSYSKFGDLRTGSVRHPDYPDFGKRFYFVDHVDGADEIKENFDPNIVPKSGYWQMDILHKMRYQATKNLEFGFNFQLSNSSDVPRSDKLALELGSHEELKFIEWNYGPQLRTLAATHVKWVGENNPVFNKMKVIASFQKINEDRLKRKFGRDQRSFQYEDVQVIAFTADFEKWLNKSSTFKFLYGGELNINNVASKAGKVDIATDLVTKNQLTRYPSGGSKMISQGAYGILQLQSKNKIFALNAGARYSNINLNAKYSREDEPHWPENFYTGLENKNSALTWGFGGTVNTKRGFQFRGLLSTAFRAPNLDDFGKIREKNGFITVPNVGVTPERSLQKELTIGQFIRKKAYYDNGKKGFAANIYVTGFHSRLFDAIVVDTFPAPNGANYIEIDEERFRTTASVNADSAIIQGVSANATFYFGPHWQLAGTWTTTQGVIIKNGSEKPLSHIPPTYGKIGLSYKTDRFQIAANVRYNGFKPIEEFGSGTADNAKNMYKEGAFAWQTYNLYTSINLGKKYSIQLGVENISDLHYRPFASGISAPGRNFIVSLRKNFQK